ncbi:MAG: hypothetical protein COZ21_11010 [Bacteroidetes bacterium CG_4_10_14_3_um_filter_31_20]|nr:MAG: hypothetical protein COZ21_11010 [Bacteroidetes bacterium CG_4_10_14_3_um_filter_31_20]
MSTVWKVFLLHTINPNKYPIYDQHIHRAFKFIKFNNEKEYLKSDYTEKEKMDFYKNTYLKFVENHIADLRIKKIDEAMYTFGRFLKQIDFKCLEKLFDNFKLENKFEYNSTAGLKLISKNNSNE